MKNAKKQLTLVDALLLAAAANAQVFILSDEEFSNNKRANAPGAGPLVPYQGGDLGQTLHTPLGGGMAILAALGGAYLLGKKRQKK